MRVLAQLVLLFGSLTVFASPILEKRDAVDTVLNDLSTLTTSVNMLDSSVNSLPQEGLVAAVAIEQEVDSIISMLQKTQSDVLVSPAQQPSMAILTTITQAASPFPLSDAVTILNAIETLQPVIVQTLNDLVTQKSEVEKLNEELAGLMQLVESDLKNLQSNTTSVENAFISAAQDSLNQAASSIEASIGGAFETAVAAYAD